MVNHKKISKKTTVSRKHIKFKNKYNFNTDFSVLQHSLINSFDHLLPDLQLHLKTDFNDAHFYDHFLTLFILLILILFLLIVGLILMKFNSINFFMVKYKIIMVLIATIGNNISIILIHINALLLLNVTILILMIKMKLFLLNNTLLNLL